MSVGHIARLLEEAHIPTVVIAVSAFGDRLEAMKPARLLLTPFWMGRPLGRPHDSATQRRVLEEALKMLSSARPPAPVVHRFDG